MGRADNKGRSSKERYVGLPNEMVRTAAFRSLSGSALKYFVELRSRYHGSNNGALHLSNGEAAALLGMSKPTAMRAQRELIAKGFLREIRHGSFYDKRASEFALTDRREDVGAKRLPTREYQSWSENSEHGSRLKPGGFRDETSTVSA